MAQKLWESVSTRLGENLATELKIDKFPVDPVRIAASKGIVVQPLPSDRTTVSGMLLKNGDDFGIMYATYLDNEGFEHFSVAHELGHYHIPNHPEALLGSGIHESRAGFRSSERHELEADHFAAGLLMPSLLFRKEINKHDSGLAAVEALSEACATSLTATAIRYAQLSPDPLAVIVSEGECVDYCFMSEELREVPELQWIRKNAPLPRDSATRKLNNSDTGVLNRERLEQPSSFQEWFEKSLDVEIYEEAVGLGRYGKTLTILTIDDLPAPEDLEDEENLQESWNPKFRR